MKCCDTTLNSIIQFDMNWNLKKLKNWKIEKSENGNNWKIRKLENWKSWVKKKKKKKKDKKVR